MKTGIFALILVLVFSVVVSADFVSPAVDFFMHNRQYDIYLRDYFRFDEAKPLRIEYNYIKWLDSISDSSEYADHIIVETDLPIYKSDHVFVSIPFSYTRTPFWTESSELNYGGNISIISPSIYSRFIITDKFRSVLGIEYNLKGDSEAFGSPSGKMVCVPNLVMSYVLIKQLNIMAGARLERYYYDTVETDYLLELGDRLYCRPIAMLNWHPSKNLIILLGLPYSGIYLSLANGIIKAQAQTSLATNNLEFGLRLRPINKTNITIRLANTPYKEIPIEGFIDAKGDFLKGRLNQTRKTFSFEAGRELNPAAIASMDFSYSPDIDFDFADNNNQRYGLDGKPYYSIGVRFTIDLEALLQLK